MFSESFGSEDIGCRIRDDLHELRKYYASIDDPQSFENAVASSSDNESTHSSLSSSPKFVLPQPVVWDNDPLFLTLHTVDYFAQEENTCLSLLRKESLILEQMRESESEIVISCHIEKLVHLSEVVENQLHRNVILHSSGEGHLYAPVFLSLGQILKERIKLKHELVNVLQLDYAILIPELESLELACYNYLTHAVCLISNSNENIAYRLSTCYLQLGSLFLDKATRLHTVCLETPSADAQADTRDCLETASDFFTAAGNCGNEFAQMISTSFFMVQGDEPNWLWWENGNFDSI